MKSSNEKDAQAWTRYVKSENDWHLSGSYSICTMGVAWYLGRPPPVTIGSDLEQALEPGRDSEMSTCESTL